MTDSSFPAWLAAQAGREARGLTRRLVEVDCGKRPLDRSSRVPRGGRRTRKTTRPNPVLAFVIRTRSPHAFGAKGGRRQLLCRDVCRSRQIWLHERRRRPTRATRGGEMAMADRG